MKKIKEAGFTAAILAVAAVGYCFLFHGKHGKERD